MAPPIVVGNVSRQKPKQRFPEAPDSPTIIPSNDLDSDDDDDDDLPQIQVDAEGPDQPPSIAQWRSNLVALSQIDNIYFAAYQDKIHVTIPQGLKQTIHGNPDLIIDLPRSRDGIRAGGHIDRVNGHNVNHIIVGDFGALEAVVVCCDDGDVVGFYTHSIQAALKASPEKQSKVRPFFHENVGISAWGLAIHAKSRMIAVSSNYREVQVFRFGCTETTRALDSDFSDLSDDGVNVFSDLPDDGADVVSDLSDERQVEDLHSRTKPTVFLNAGYMGSVRARRTWSSFRKILKLTEGHNIPSIDFSSDSNGDAHAVLATDILGNLWILDIWQDGGDPENWVKRIPSMHKQSLRGNAPMGWGALALPLRAFQSTASAEDALGIGAGQLPLVCKPRPVTRGKSHYMFDITHTLSKVDIDNKSAYHPMYGYGIGGPGTIPMLPHENTAGLGSWAPSEQPRSGSQTASEEVGSKPDVDLCSTPEPLVDAETARKFFKAVVNTSFHQSVANMAYVDEHTKGVNTRRLAELPNPFQGLFQRRLEMLDPESGIGLKPAGCPSFRKPPVYYLQDKCAILRTYQDDIELIPPTESMGKTVCRKVLKQDLPMALGHQVGYERLIFPHLIAELSLVIVGSQIGRVCLISLTRPDDSFSRHGPVTMFRVDHILPTYTHEIQGFRPSVPLMGIALSPLQGQQKGRKIWRLIMHYHDHSILSYELSRDGGELLVI